MKKIKFMGEFTADGVQKISIMITDKERVLYEYTMRVPMWIKPSWEKHFKFSDIKTIEKNSSNVRKLYPDRSEQ